MGVKNDGEQDEIDNLNEVDDEIVEGLVEEDDPPADDDTSADDVEGDGEGEGDQIVVSLGEEPEPGEDDEKRAPDWVRELRKSNREKDRKLREQEAEISRLKGTSQSAAVVVGEKPTLESCDYDTDKFERDLEAWHTRKREADEQKRARDQQAEQLQSQWQARTDAVSKAATALKLPDYEDALLAFEDLFPEIVHRGIIMGGPEDPKASALLRYALGKNPKKAKELAAIKDPVKFAFAVAKLETQLKVIPRKSAPPPDRRVGSSVAGAAAVDSQLARLQAEADKTGDRSKVAIYLRTKQKAKQAA